MKIVLDAAGILNFRNLPEGEYCTTAEVKDEIKDLESKALFEIRKIKTMLASKESLEKVRECAEKTGDLLKLSKADLSILALCLDLKDCLLMTDDYSVQNVSKELNIEFKGILFKKIKEKRVYKMKCPACAKEYKIETDECFVCGTKLKRIKK